MKKIVLGLFLLSGLFAHGQQLNQYKYVLVPKTFEFLKKTDEYQLNSLTKFLFNKYGFEAYKDGDKMPFDFNPYKRNCDVIHSDVIAENGLIYTKISVVLKDCSGAILYTTPEGRSKKKDFKWAYREALRKAFEHMTTLGYKYDSPVNEFEKNQRLETITDTGSEQVTTLPSVKIERELTTTPSQEIKAGIPLSTQKKSAPLHKPEVQMYKSNSSSYKVIARDDYYFIFDGDKEIGKATKTSGDTFLVKTTDFDGVGKLSGNQFIIEREIKGVEGLVRMIFERQ